MKIWVTKLGGDPTSKFGIILDETIYDVDDLRKAVNKSDEISKDPSRFGHGAVDILADASGLPVHRIDVTEPLFEGASLRWNSLYFSEPPLKCLPTPEIYASASITQTQFTQLMSSIEKVNEKVDRKNDEIKQLIGPKVECMNASMATSNDLHEMFNDEEIDVRFIINAYDEGFDEGILQGIFNDLKDHTESVIRVTVKKGQETSEIRDIQSLSFELLKKVTARLLPAETYEVKRNGFFKTPDIVAESSNRVVKYKGRFDEMINAKGTSFSVFSLEDKNPKTKRIPKKSVTQGVIENCAIYRSLSSIDCVPKHLFTLVHNGIEWIAILRKINSFGAEQYLCTLPVECTKYDKKTKVTEIDEAGLWVVSRLLYIVMKTAMKALAAVQSRLRHLLSTNPQEYFDDSDKDDTEDRDDNAEKQDDATGGLSTLLGSLKPPSGQVSTQSGKQPKPTSGTKSTAGRGGKKKSVHSFARQFQFLQLTSKNLLLAPAMC